MKPQLITMLLHDREVSVRISDVAGKRLREIAVPLLFDIELYFSCLIRKVCRFSEMENDENASRVMEGLYIRFRASMTSHCAIADFDINKVADFPVVRQTPCIPKWVILDYTGNQWVVDFGYASAP